MEKIERVEKGLEHCSSSLGCFECPYSEMDKRSIECQLQLDRDALALLKEQQKIIDRYHQADTFLDAHGWKWKDGEQE